MEEFVDAGLRHHCTPPEEVLRDTRLPAEVASLYLMTELLRSVTMDGSGELDELQAGADVYARQLLSR
jgi:hypothetical protein